jgi:hypothetical protein
MDGGIPGFLNIPQEERSAGWEGRRLTIQGSSVEAAPTKAEEAAPRQLPRKVEKQVAHFPAPAPKFDYTLLESADAADLRARAIRLRGLMTKSTTDMINIGVELLAIRDLLDHGQFKNWVEREVDVDVRTVQVYMSIARLAEGKSELISLLSPSTARLLAAKSAPTEIIEQVIARASSGEIVHHVVVKDLISEKRAERESRGEREPKARSPKSASEKERPRLGEANERYRERAESERAENIARAKSIIERLSPDDVTFLADILTEEVLLEFGHLVKGSVQ